MRWTADNDQLLFMKLIETHDVTVKSQKIHEAWPRVEGSDVPTARAISERLAKLRSTNKASFTTSTSSSPSSSTKNTPRKRKNGGNTASGQKTSRVGDSTEEGVGGEVGEMGAIGAAGAAGPPRKKRERKKLPTTQPDFAKAGLEEGSSTPFPSVFGLSGKERWRDGPFNRHVKELLGSKGVGSRGKEEEAERGG